MQVQKQPERVLRDNRLATKLREIHSFSIMYSGLMGQIACSPAMKPEDAAKDVLDRRRDVKYRLERGMGEISLGILADYGVSPVKDQFVRIFPVKSFEKRYDSVTVVIGNRKKGSVPDLFCDAVHYEIYPDGRVIAKHFDDKGRISKIEEKKAEKEF